MNFQVYKLMNQIKIVYSEYSESILQIEEELSQILESIRPQIEFLRKLATEYKYNFESEFLEKNKKEFLLQNGWALSPYLLNTSIEEKLSSDKIMESKNSEINAIFEEFFSKNKYEELESMINTWSGNKYFQKRMSIFSDCIVLLRSFRVNKRNQKVNPSRMILPLLISQIDGINLEYAKSSLIMNKNRLQNSSGQNVGKFHNILTRPSYSHHGIFLFILLQEYLFSMVYPYGQQDPNSNKEKPKKVKFRPFFQFSRNKIMHGEDLNFGTIDNALRAFLLLDFLANLK